MQHFCIASIQIINTQGQEMPVFARQLEAMACRAVPCGKRSDGPGHPRDFYVEVGIQSEYVYWNTPICGAAWNQVTEFHRSWLRGLHATFGLPGTAKVKTTRTAPTTAHVSHSATASFFQCTVFSLFLIYALVHFHNFYASFDHLLWTCYGIDSVKK